MDTHSLLGSGRSALFLLNLLGIRRFVYSYLQVTVRTLSTQYKWWRVNGLIHTSPKILNFVNYVTLGCHLSSPTVPTCSQLAFFFFSHQLACYQVLYTFIGNPPIPISNSVVPVICLLSVCCLLLYTLLFSYRSVVEQRRLIVLNRTSHHCHYHPAVFIRSLALFIHRPTLFNYHPNTSTTI